MVDIVNHVGTEFSVTDRATTQMTAMAGQAGLLSKKFNAASAIVGTFAGVAAVAGGAFSAVKAIKGTQDLLENVKKVQDYTRMSAESAGGLLDAMEQSGIEGAEGVRSLMMMSKAGQRMEMSMMGSGRHLGYQARMFKQMGIDLHKGPEASLRRMAELSKKGQLSQAQLSIMFRMNGETARKFSNMLARGPEYIQKHTAEFKKLQIATQENVDRQRRIKELTFGIKSTWSSIQQVIAVQLLPVLERVLESVKVGLDSWLPKAQAFGEMLGGFLKDHLSAAMKLGKILLLNFALMKASGGAGVLDVGKKAVGVGWKATGAVASMATRGLGAIPGMAAITGIFGKLGTAAPMLFKFVTGALRLSIIGIGITGIVVLITTAWRMFQKNIGGFRDLVMVWFARLKDRLSVFIDLFTETFGEGSTLANFFTAIIPPIFNALAAVTDAILQVLQVIMVVVREVIKSPGRLVTDLFGLFADANAEVNARILQKEQQRGQREADRAVAKKTKASDTPETRQAPYNDFRGSKFDIEQKFAEGFDPDRIAVAFSNDLAALADRRLQPGLSPLFAVR